MIRVNFHPVVNDEIQDATFIVETNYAFGSRPTFDDNGNFVYRFSFNAVQQEFFFPSSVFDGLRFTLQVDGAADPTRPVSEGGSGSGRQFGMTPFATYAFSSKESEATTARLDDFSGSGQTVEEAVASAQSSVGDLDMRVTSAEADIASVSQQVSDIGSSSESMATALAEARAEIADLRALLEQEIATRTEETRVLRRKVRRNVRRTRGKENRGR